MDIKMAPQQELKLYALEEIRDLPLNFDKPLYRHYPAMKLGQLQDVDFFSQQLGVIAANVLKNDINKNGSNNNWVLTAPLYYELPAAANLLARKVHESLQAQGFTISLVEPRLGQRQIAIRNQQEFNSYHDYSKNNLQQRIAEREKVQQTLDADALMPTFKDHSVIVINDINVTGTQQYFMQQLFNDFGVKQSHWLYIFNVDKALAHRHPEIEYQINNSQINDLDSFARILGDENNQYTARCIARLFNEDFKDFHYLISFLDKQRREIIYQLAQQEGRYNHSFFDEKMNLLASASHKIHSVNH